jgi:hypothetical protein
MYFSQIEQWVFAAITYGSTIVGRKHFADPVFKGENKCPRDRFFWLLQV